jgi:BirA family biotin operon repressor/biotin-[acetyl-CoA-carboxylase] ligase
VAEAIHRMGAPDVKVKWPNDLVVNERKLCGILIDLTQTAGKTNVVVGIGINVDLTRADKGKIDRSVIDLRELGLKQSRTEILIQIVGSLQTMLRRFEDEGFQSFIETFNHHHAYQDQSCTVHMGDRIIEGVVRGVAIDGALVMETDRGYEHFRGGEVSLRKY